MTQDNRIKTWRKARGLSAQRLAEMVNTGRSTIVKLERGERRLTQDWMRRIAMALEIAPTQLLPLDENRPASYPITLAPLLDLQSVVDAIRDGVLVEIINARGAIMDLGSAVPVPQGSANLFAVTMWDSSMDREIPLRAFVVIDPDDTALHDRAIFLLAHRGEAFVRQFRSGPDRLVALSAAQEIEPIFDLGGVTLVGRVTFVARPM